MAVRILNGEKPTDIPVETLENTEIVINMQTARTLNITIPQDILDVATKIEKWLLVFLNKVLFTGY